MQIDWWTLGLQIVNALVLIWLLSRFLFRPIASILAEREAAARRLLDDAAAAKASALSLEERARAAVDAMAADRAATILAATTEAKDARDQLLIAARADADRMRADMRAEIERAERSARRAEAERASLLAVDIARRLLGRLPASSRVAGFIDGLADAVAALPETARADFAARGERILTAPRPLTAEEDALCRGRLESALGHPLQFALRVDPTLLAGLELENAHTSIRNSLRADLEQISATLLKEPENER
ncbi:MAG TPA: F0F1 ATP synthase subunit B [Methylosinus sp.]|jgi:F-type H+-transporting ATPase subunit b|uniref:F0F1 ATP synthase subunit B family protein n=1 Tax=Methylosinus sp. TaxID=427 RepID=UPI002F93EFA4